MKLISLLKPPPANTRLTLTEWTGVLFLSGIFLTFTLITYSQESLWQIEDSKTSQFLYNQTIEVYVEGAVASAGRYEMKKGDRLEKLLMLAKPTKEADLRKLKLHSKLRQGQSIRVPVKEMITIYVEGEVKTNGAYLIPKGTKRNEVAQFLDLLPEVEMQPLKGSKLLKDGEKIVVSVNKIESKKN